jgi:hypothetical protein
LPSVFATSFSVTAAPSISAATIIIDVTIGIPINVAIDVALTAAATFIAVTT